MSIELPGWVTPILNAYGIPWPDVNEDAFHSMKQPLRAFGQDLVAVSDAIEKALGDLESGNPSQTLRALSTYCSNIRRDFLDPIQYVCDDLAGTPCDVAYDAIVTLKWTLIGLLLGEIEDDIADVVATVVTLGADVELTAAEALVVREAIREAIEYGEGEVAYRLQSAADGYLDNFISSLVNPFIDSVEKGVEARVASYIPALVLQEAARIDDAVADRLHLSPEQVDSAIAALWQASDHLVAASSRLDHAIDEIFSVPDPHTSGIHNVSQSLRLALQSVASTIKSDLFTGIDNLLHHVEGHFATLLEDFVRAAAELDEFARRAAAAERMAAEPEVVVLSAVSTWVGASGRVDEVSAVVNAEEADRVQVREASAVGLSPDMGASAEKSGVVTQPIGAAGPIQAPVSGVDNLTLKAELGGPGMAEADKGLGQVEELKVTVNQSGPHVDMAQAAGVNVQATGPHHGEQPNPNVRVAESGTAATNVQHPHSRHDQKAMTVGGADEHGEGVEPVTPGSGSESGGS
jgi:hypothetical protein